VLSRVFARWRRPAPTPPEAAEDFPPAWRALLAQRVPIWSWLDDDGRSRLEERTAGLLATKRWEAAHGFVLTEEMQVTIAGQAAVLVLGLDEDWYRLVSAVIVHPTTVTLQSERQGPVAGTRSDDALAIIGQATGERGPLLIAWDAVLDAVAHPQRGEHVVLHEFAHKLDMLDGYADGMPPLAEEARSRWAEVFDAELDRLRSGSPDPVLRPYAATNLAELFAVATEAFFCAPAAVAAGRPELYGLLRDFYRQDPAASSAASSAGALSHDEPAP
jgi:Mlc titration factor MtfA (ptsG expression regulator)